MEASKISHKKLPSVHLSYSIVAYIEVYFFTLKCISPSVFLPVYFSCVFLRVHLSYSIMTYIEVYFSECIAPYGKVYFSCCIGVYF